MLKQGFQASDGKFFLLTAKEEAEKYERSLGEKQKPDGPMCAFNGCRGCAECIAYANDPLHRRYLRYE